MKVRNILFGILVCSFFLVLNSGVNASDKHERDWEAFSRNLVNAIKSQNKGLQSSAMQQIIVYSDSLNVEESVRELANIYKSDKNDDNVRRLALQALYKIDRKYVADHFRRNIRFESNDQLRQDLIVMIQKYDKDMAFQSALSAQ